MHGWPSLYILNIALIFSYILTTCCQLFPHLTIPPLCHSLLPPSSYTLFRCAGELSFAMVEGNASCEDFTRVDVGPFGTFVAVFDGHGGKHASKYACEHLLENITSECCLAA